VTSRTRHLCLLTGMLLLLCVPRLFAQPAFVHDDAAELVSSADFDGDGRLDVLVVDRATGNARVGFQTSAGILSWSQPISTGVAGPASVAVGNFFGTNRSAIAVTSLEQTRFVVRDLVNTNLAAQGYPKNLPVGLLTPYRTAAMPAAVPDWTCAGANREPGITIVELFDYLGASLLHRGGTRSIVGELHQGNALQFNPGDEWLVAAMQRGSNSTFVALSLTNGYSTVLTRSNLASGARYAFGRFNSEPLPRLLFYVPGHSNITVQRVITTPTGFDFGAATVTTFTSAVQRVYVIDEQTNSLAVIRFGDRLVGARLPAGNNTLSTTYHFGAGPTGIPIAGVSLGNGRLALLTGASTGGASIGSLTYQLTGSGYVLSGSNTLPAVASYASRANVWLFATEPFVTSPAVFVSSLNAGDWVTSVAGLPGSLNIVSEQDRGTSAGLGNSTPQVLAVPANTAVHALANQYHPAISLFSYAGVRAPQPSLVVISPAPGHYPGEINVSFAKSNSSDSVFYRIGSSGSFDSYLSPFVLRTNAQIHYYGVTSGGERSVLQVASYTFDTGTYAPLVTTNGTGTNNIPEPPPPTGATSGVPTYAYGTIFYSRRTGTNGAIWSISLDGIGDRFITEGTRPRISPDGRYLAFLRGGRPFDTIPQDNGSIWIRDLLTGQERILVTRTNLIVGFDWEYGNTNLVFDHGCRLYRTDLAGNVTALPFSTDCPEDAPSVSPLDGRLAFHAVAPLATNYGIYVTDSGISSKHYVDLPLIKPRRPSWSPDGAQLALADYAFTYIPESGMNLYVVNPDGTELHQITGFSQIEGFREGALWTPNADALVGAATMDSVNGIWIVPLSEDRTHCESPPFRLPTVSGDDIDFVGSIFVPPGPPRLKIRREGIDVIVSWRRSAWPYILQAAPDPNAGWQDVAGPYTTSGTEYQVRIVNAWSLPNTFFRLRLP
jgi:Tol biopolymer transport system component